MNWKQFWGEAKRKWGDLTDDALMEVNGRREKLEGKGRERYGTAKDNARHEINAWTHNLK